MHQGNGSHLRNKKVRCGIPKGYPGIPGGQSLRYIPVFPDCIQTVSHSRYRHRVASGDACRFLFRNPYRKHCTWNSACIRYIFWKHGILCRYGISDRRYVGHSYCREDDNPLSCGTEGGCGSPLKQQLDLFPEQWQSRKRTLCYRASAEFYICHPDSSVYFYS